MRVMPTDMPPTCYRSHAIDLNVMTSQTKSFPMTETEPLTGRMSEKVWVQLVHWKHNFCEVQEIYWSGIVIHLAGVACLFTIFFIMNWEWLLNSRFKINKVVKRNVSYPFTNHNLFNLNWEWFTFSVQTLRCMLMILLRTP